MYKYSKLRRNWLTFIFAQQLDYSIHLFQYISLHFFCHIKLSSMSFSLTLLSNFRTNQVLAFNAECNDFQSTFSEISKSFRYMHLLRMFSTVQIDVIDVFVAQPLQFLNSFSEHF